MNTRRGFSGMWIIGLGAILAVLILGVGVWMMQKRSAGGATEIPGTAVQKPAENETDGTPIEATTDDLQKELDEISNEEIEVKIEELEQL